MKKTLSLFLLPLLFLGCTWIQDYRVKGRVIEDHKRRVHTVTRSLYELALPGNPRGNDFASVVVNQTEIEVTEIKETSDNKYSVVMKVRSITPAALSTMVEIVRPLSETDMSAFNFTDGFNLIRQKNSIKVDGVEEVRVHTSL